MKTTSKLFIKSLTDLSNGTSTLLLGLRTSSRTEVQHASTQLENGATEFQNAIDQVRRKSGPAGEPTVVPRNLGSFADTYLVGLP